MRWAKACIKLNEDLIGKSGYHQEENRMAHGLKQFGKANRQLRRESL